MVDVPNPYLAAIKAEKSRTSGDVTALSGLLNGVVGMFHTAWEGGLADQTCDRMASLGRAAAEAGASATAAYDTAIAGQPAQVDEDAWQTRWRSLNW